MNLQPFLLFLVGLFLMHEVLGQAPKKVLNVERTDEAIAIDGVLDEAVWQNSDVANDFVMFEPVNGAPEKPQFKTEVRITYDDQAIYIAASMYDPHPDSILRQLTERDDFNQNTDWFGFFLNPYNDGLSDFNFWVTAAGVQADSRTTANGDDFGLNSVWKSAVQITDFGWVAEIALPYLAIRFPEDLSNDWGLNFMRNIRRNRNQYSWSFLDISSGYRLEYQSGLLRGIKDIDPPVRLSLMPYASAYAENYNGEDVTNFNAGLDLKYGLSEGFTLDMTLIPDFGQVAYDQQFLNLSPFENRFEENRQFFTEGTELFTIGDIFYSRRIGGTPKNIQGVDLAESDSVEINLEYTKLLNATKISGRNANNLGIGFLNAVTDDNFSTRLEDGEQTLVLTEPLTNYNVMVFDKRFNRNSSVSLVNTNVLRKGAARDANVTALLTSLYNKSGSLLLDAGIKQSALFYPDSLSTGYDGSLSLGKVSGNWRWFVDNRLITADYEVNDLGFQQRSNRQSHYGEFGFWSTQPVGKFIKLQHKLYSGYTRLLEPYRFEDAYLGYDFFHLKSTFFAYGGEASVSFESYDYFEPRNPGRWFKRPTRYFANGFISTDFRKVLATNARFFMEIWNEMDRKEYVFELEPRIRLGDHLFMLPEFTYSLAFNDYGYVSDLGPSTVFFGRRNNEMIQSALNMRYVFDPRTVISVAARHTAADVDYESFYLLEANGDLSPTDGYTQSDINFNTWNVDVRFSWWFAPGSEMVILYRNITASSSSVVGESYLQNIENVLNTSMRNNISLRLTYFLDYNYLRRKA